MLALASKSSDSPLAKADFTELHASDEGIYFEAHPAIGEKYSVILRRAGKEFIETEHRTGASTEIMKHSMHSYAARFCEVRVHDRTSEVRVNRWIGAFDAGRIINPKTAISQFRGGIIMDIGMALTEETLFEDRTGGVMNPSLAECHVPVQADIPQIDIVYTDVADPHTPMKSAKSELPA